MATIITAKNGRKVVLLDPAERSRRYARELKSGYKHDGSPLSDAEAGFRMGVLNERAVQVKIFKKKRGKKPKKSGKR